MAALTFPTGEGYKSYIFGGVRIDTMVFASISDGDTVTVPMALAKFAFIAGSHTAGIATSVELGAPTNAGTPLTLHTTTAAVPATVVVFGH
jgi:hypothetical protein